MKKSVMIGVIIAIIVIIALVIFLNPDSELSSDSSLNPASSLSCEAQYNDLIKDIENNNDCSGKCFSLPLMGSQAFTDLGLSECYYFVNRVANLDRLNLKLIRFMSNCKDVYDQFLDKCSSRPQVVCSQGKCISYFDTLDG